MKVSLFKRLFENPILSELYSITDLDPLGWDTKYDRTQGLTVQRLQHGHIEITVIRRPSGVEIAVHPHHYYVTGFIERWRFIKLIRYISLVSIRGYSDKLAEKVIARKQKELERENHRIDRLLAGKNDPQELVDTIRNVFNAIK
jgi:hypothetical protein